MPIRTEPITIHLTDTELQDLDRLAGRMEQGRNELIQEIISRALDTLRMMEDAGL